MRMINSHKFPKCAALFSSREIIGLTVNCKSELFCYQMKKKEGSVIS